MNKVMGLLLAVSLAFLAGQKVDGWQFKLPDWGWGLPDIIDSKFSGPGHLIIVDDKENPSEGISELTRDLGWRSMVSGKGIPARFYDDSQDAARNYTEVLGPDMPGVLLISEAGKLIAKEGIGDRSGRQFMDEFLGKHFDG